MKWPRLVREARTKAHVVLEANEISEHGRRDKALDAVLLCNYQSKARQVLTAEKVLIEIAGVALFDGDICPTLAVLSAGTVTIHGIEHKIYRGSKERNPDGTVNFTRLELV